MPVRDKIVLELVALWLDQQMVKPQETDVGLWKSELRDTTADEVIDPASLDERADSSSCRVGAGEQSTTGSIGGSSCQASLLFSFANIFG